MADPALTIAVVDPTWSIVRLVGVHGILFLRERHLFIDLVLRYLGRPN